MGLLKLLWARPTILLIGLAIGVVIGLNLTPDTGAPISAPAVATASVATAAASAPTIARPRAAAVRVGGAPLSGPIPASPDVRIQLAKLAAAGRPLNVGVFG